MADNKEPDPTGIHKSGFLRKVDREQGYKKAAEFILLLEKGKAAMVLAQLSDEEVEGIVGEIARLKNIDSAESKKIAAEFGVPELKRQASNGENDASAGVETAREMLMSAFGEERSRQVIDKIEQQQHDYFAFLRDIKPARISSLLQGESPQVISLVIAHLDASVVSAVIQSMKEDARVEAAGRVAQMDKVLPEVIRRTADELKKKLFQQSDLTSQSFDGKSALREILRNMDFGQEQVILETLSVQKPELAYEIEKELFTMEIFRRLRRKDMQLFFSEINDRDFAICLKGESLELKEFLLTAVSARRKARILDESDMIGEVTKNEPDTIKQNILVALKKKMRSGDIYFTDGKDTLVQ